MKRPNLLRRVRLDAGLGQVELEKKSGVFQSRISLFERGLAAPSRREQKALAKALGLAEDFPFNQEV